MAADAREMPSRLEGWKMIAAFVGRDERTAKRWEIARGLPVRRLPGENRSMVFAYAHELSAWRDSNKAEDAPAAAPEPVTPAEPPAIAVPSPARRGRRVIAAAATAMIAVALAIAAPWRAALPDAEAGGTRDPAAASDVRRGKLDWSLRTKDSLEAALALFHDAVRRDPRYARAYVGLAQTYSLLREYGAMPDAEAYPKAEAAAQRALAIAPDLAEAHAALAFALFWWDWDRAAAEREFREAIRLDPSAATPHLWLATAFQAEMRMSAALAEVHRAQELDPGCAACAANEAGILLTMGRWAEATAILRHLETVDGSLVSPHALLAQIAWSRGEDPAYLAEASVAARLRGDAAGERRIAEQRTAWRTGGRPAIEVAMIASARRSLTEGAGPFAVARLLAMGGDRPGALAMLELALHAHDPGLMGMACDLALAPLRREPRFLAVLAAVKAGP